MKRIKLTQGKYALVDNEDFEVLSKFKWSCHSKGKYAHRPIRREDGKWTNQQIHRFILGLKIDDKRFVDHINGITLDNRKENLRICTNAENTMNGKSRGGSSVFKGVCWHKGAKKWMAHIKLNGRQKYLGLFTSEKEAAEAYDKEALILFADFARPNFKIDAQRMELRQGVLL